MSVSLSISHGSPIGGQPITITGEAFGDDPGQVSLGGLACTVEAWTDSAISILTPLRRDSGGIYIRTADTVALVVTLADASTLQASYTYTVTIFDLAMAQIATALTSLSRASGDNFTVSAGQVLGYKTQETNSGSEWPQFDFVGEVIRYGESGSDTPYGSDTGNMGFFVRGTMPLSEPANWDFELRALLRDMHRAIRKARNSDEQALEIRIDDCTTGKLDGETAGAFGIAIVSGTIIAKHINVNMNTRTEGE